MAGGWKIAQYKCECGEEFVSGCHWLAEWVCCPKCCKLVQVEPLPIIISEILGEEDGVCNGRTDLDGAEVAAGDIPGAEHGWGYKPSG